MMETMIDSGRLEVVRNKYGFSNGLCVNSVGNSDGLGLWWRDQNVDLISYSSHHISITVEDYRGDCKWKAHGIYGWPERTNKYKTWELMNSLAQGYHGPYVVFGDFNEILRGIEKEGGTPRCDKDMDAFR